MNETSKWFLLGMGSMAAFYAAYFGAWYAYDRHRKKQKLRQEYEKEFGFQPPEYYSSGDMERELTRHRKYKL